MMAFPGAVSAHGEAEFALDQQGWISLQNTIVEHRGYSSQPQVLPRESHLGLVNQDMYNALWLLVIVDDSRWSGV